MSSQLFTNITGTQRGKKVYIQAEWPIRPELVPVSVHEATRNISTPPPHPHGWDASPSQG